MKYDPLILITDESRQSSDLIERIKDSEYISGRDYMIISREETIAPEAPLLICQDGTTYSTKEDIERVFGLYR